MILFGPSQFLGLGLDRLQPPPLEAQVDRHYQFVGGERLGQEVKRSPSDRLYRQFDGGKAGDDDADGVRVTAQDRVDQVQATAIG
jgi:hypothetical protein